MDKKICYLICFIVGFCIIILGNYTTYKTNELRNELNNKENISLEIYCFKKDINKINTFNEILDYSYINNYNLSEKELFIITKYILDPNNICNISISHDKMYHEAEIRYLNNIQYFLNKRMKFNLNISNNSIILMSNLINKKDNLIRFYNISYNKSKFGFVFCEIIPDDNISDNYCINKQLKGYEKIGGGSIKFKNGIYLLNNTITTRSNTKLKGTYGKSVLKLCRNFTPAINVTGNNVEISNLVIDGNFSHKLGQISRKI
jgi:hypothetical protein